MGFWRTVYREARDVLGLPPPVETAVQLAERIRDEVAGDLGGLKSRAGEGSDVPWVLTTELEGREVVLTCHPDGLRVSWRIASTLGGGPAFRLVAETHSAADPASARKAIGTGLNLEADDADALGTEEMLWKALPTGTRGNLTSLIQRLVGRFTFEDDFFLLDTEAEFLASSGAASQLRSQTRTIARLVGEVEQAWSAL